ncbi:MAG: CobW family GTP-binding protein [Saezia sp.]
MDLIPATIVTGFLGSGKTTLLQRVLAESHGQKIVVIENEFGEESIDHELLFTETKEQIIQLNNGCICCSIREDLRSALVMLLDKRWKGELDFDRVIIETTGVADPGPVAKTFVMDGEVAAAYMLDSIITLVDAKHGHRTLDQRLEAQRQVGFADQIFISKSDLVSKQELESLQQRLMRMNPRAPQKIVNFGDAPLIEVLDLRGFNLSAKLDIAPDFLKEDDDHHHDEHCCCEHAHEHHHDCECESHHHEGCEHEHHTHGAECGCGHDHRHDDDVKSFVFRSDKPFDGDKLEQFLGEILDIYGPQMLRYKGILNMSDTDHKVVFQGVNEVLGSDLGPKWQPGEMKETKIVFIGIDLPKEIFLQGLQHCLVHSEN